MYAHQLVTCEHQTAMVHYRENTDPNTGLISVREIGHTYALNPNAPITPAYDQLLLPDPMHIALVESTRAEPSTVDSHGRYHEQVPCGDLDEFIHVGVARWREILDNIRGQSTVYPTLAEVRSTVQEYTDSGLEIVHAQPETEFRHFVATPPEIEAINSIAYAPALSPRPDQDGPSTGQYI